LRERLLIRRAVRIFREQAPGALDDALEFAYRFRLGELAIAPIQIRSELGALLEELRDLQPKALLEIGTSRGGTLFMFTRVAAPNALLISLDLPASDSGRRKRLYESFARDRQRVVFLTADSHSPEALAEVRRHLGDRQLDFLFVDGDHAAEGVRKDFTMYAPLVRHGGLIALHDIADGPAELVGGVPDFWRTVKNRDAVELIENAGQEGFGIGVLRR
jgi:predicted O-methyltransferase YrrM